MKEEDTEAEVKVVEAEVATEAEEMGIDPTPREAEAAQDHPEEAEVKLEEKTSQPQLRLKSRLKNDNLSSGQSSSELSELLHITLIS